MTELERRDTPAWWSVAAPVPAGGAVGSTDATHVGEITLRAELPVTNGVATVWADTAAAAVSKALVGTLTVTLLGESVEYAFGPDTVGAAIADHKAFLAVATGSSVSLGFEDMAGRPSCDYDYNDRTWGGVTAAGADDPVIFEGDFLWTGTTGDATVHERVEALSATVYKWDYFVRNDSFQSSFMAGLGVGAAGIGRVYLPSLSKEFVFDSYSSRGGVTLFSQPAGPGEGEVVFSFGTSQYDGILPGESAEFWLTTAPQPLAPRSGLGTDFGFLWRTTGPVMAPGKANADITIDGDLTVGATNPEVPGSKAVVTQFSPNNDTNEDTIGGLVVMNSNSNNARRQQITIQKLKDAAGNPVVGGQVTLTVPEQVKVYDAKGNSVATGTVFDQTALPKKLWVEGVAYSGQMMDVKIKATPVGNPAGADDVSFTVLWVDVTVATDGKVSANNDKIQATKDEHFDADGKNTDALGIIKLVQPNFTAIGWSLEGRGLVHPWDFSYPGSDLRHRRDWNNKTFITPPAGAGQPIVEQTNGFVDDTSNPFWQDNNLLDSCGFIYDLDAPGLGTSGPDSFHAQGTVARYRSNFRQFAAITINGTSTRASGIYAYYVRFSLVQTGIGVNNKWVLITPPDIAGDNKAFGPDQTKLSADLS